MLFSRRMRSVLATAVATGALFALPGSAHAAIVTTTVTKDATNASINPGDTVPYTVVFTTDATTTAGGIVDLDPNYTTNGAAIVSGAFVSGSKTPTFTLDGAGLDVTIPAGFTAAGPIRVTVQVKLPSRRIVQPTQTGFRVSATAPTTTGFSSAINTSSATTDVYRGDGTKTSKLYGSWSAVTSAPAGLGDWWAPKDSTVTATYTVFNWGDGSAYGVEVDPWDATTTSPIHPAKPKSDTELDFAPVVTVVGSPDCVATPDSTMCTFDEVPAGGSKSVVVNIAGLDHLGARVTPQASLSLSTMLEKTRVLESPRWNGTDSFTGRRDAAGVKITNGLAALPMVSMKGPSIAAGRSDLPYNFEITNGGPSAIDASVLRVVADAFTDKGDRASTYVHAGDAGVIESIKSISLSNGATCAPATNFEYRNAASVYEPKARIGTWDCGIARIAVGERITGTVIVNFATGHVDSRVTDDPSDGWTGTGSESGNVTIKLHTPLFDMGGSQVGANAYTQLNRASNADLSVSVRSAAQIGARRLGLQVVTVKNTGPAAAVNASLSGRTWRNRGTFEPTLLPRNCTGVVDPLSLRCALGTIPAGKSVSVTVPVVATGRVKSTMVTSYSADSFETDTNRDNNSIAHTMQVVKASQAPLTGVRIMKQKRTNIAQVAKQGLSTTVRCPGACVVKSELQVSRKVAERLGLVKPRQSTRRARAAKAPLPYIVVGVGTKKITRSGKVVVKAKFSRKYKAQIASLRTSLTVNRVVTVASTAKLTKGATYTKGQNVVLKVSKAKRSRR